jgi:hypothetical protein
MECVYHVPAFKQALFQGHIQWQKRKADPRSNSFYVTDFIVPIPNETAMFEALLRMYTPIQNRWADIIRPT